MTIFYLDLEGGNDANDGLSFANRWLTFANGATAARTAPGDTIRVMATPDPVSLGSATWTDNSGAIVWAAAKNKVIDNCESGWVASANVNLSHTTSQKQGTARLQLAFLTAFTTGKAAYKTLAAPLDLSLFDQISFWCQTNTGTPTFSVKLCSDTTGDTPVATIPFTLSAGTEITSNFWKPTVGNNGAALGATINSIAIYMDADPATMQLRFDNFVACKAAGSADEVTHKLLYGKNTAGEPEWYNISEITDTGIVLGGNYTSGPSGDPAMPYRGATEAVATFKRYCFAPGGSAEITLKEGGTEGSPILYSGGWNRTDMSTQTGETWLSGDRGSPYGLSFPSAATYLNTEKFGVAYFYSAGVNNINGFQIHDMVGSVGCSSLANAYTYSSSHPGRGTLNIDHVWGCNSGALGNFNRPLNFTARLIHGDCDTLTGAGAFSGVSSYGSESYYNIQRIENNASNGLYVSAHHNLKLKGATLKNNAGSDIYFNSTIYAKVELDDCELLSTTPVSANGTVGSWELYETRIGGVPTANKTSGAFRYFQTQAAVVHSGAVAWELGFTNSVAYWAEEPTLLPLATVACNAGALVTFKAWLRRDNAAVGAGLHLREDAVQGIAQTTVWMTAAIDTWEEVTITFTPTSAGVYEIFAAGYGPVGNKAYFDGDITVTQA